jgi:hypothetical protein
LSNILLYHVVPGKVMAADVSDGLSADTLQGSPVTFTVADDKVMINDANIVATDIEASNGVIHVIDSVLLPPAPEAMAEETMAEETMAEEAPAPEAMPVTGGSDANGTLFAVATLIVAVLAGFALLFRRRMA